MHFTNLSPNGVTTIFNLQKARAEVCTIYLYKLSMLFLHLDFKCRVYKRFKSQLCDKESVNKYRICFKMIEVLHSDVEECVLCKMHSIIDACLLY